FSGVSTIASTKKIDSNQTRVYNTRSRARMANEGSGPGRNLSMEFDEMKDKMECMVELQSPAMNIPTAQGGIPIGGTVNGLNLNQFTMPVGEGYQPVDRVHTEVPAQVIDNATGSHTESGKDK
ncbi:hypothetical protein PIB30_108394, partial [Stylosanthes scabra]|nr:hypothetical protein [Stylosanthes scabra]